MSKHQSDKALSRSDIVGAAVHVVDAKRKTGQWDEALLRDLEAAVERWKRL